jgi:hypothetical protein
MALRLGQAQTNHTCGEGSMAEFTLEIGKLNNEHDPIKLGSVDFRERTLTTVTQVQNFDLDNEGLATCRLGRSLIHSGEAHSFWVHPFDQTLAYFIKETGMYKLNSDYSATLITYVNPKLRGYFDLVGSGIVFSNGEQIGWVEYDTFVEFDQTLIQSEERMPPGQLIAYDHTDNILLVATSGVLYKSKPYNAEVSDGRLNKFPFDGYVRMIATVEDGWWVATDKRVGFVSRDGGDDYTYKHVSDEPPPEGCFTSGWEEVEGGSRRFVTWASPDGFCVGRSGGSYINLSDGVSLPSGSRGYLFDRDYNGTKQFISVVHDPENTGKFVPPTLTVNTITVS